MEDSFLVFVYGFCEYLLEDAFEDLILDACFVCVESGPFVLAAAPLREQNVIYVVRPPGTNAC